MKKTIDKNLKEADLLPIIEQYCQGASGVKRDANGAELWQVWEKPSAWFNKRQWCLSYRGVHIGHYEPNTGELSLLDLVYDRTFIAGPWLP